MSHKRVVIEVSRGLMSIPRIDERVALAIADDDTVVQAAAAAVDANPTIAYTNPGVEADAIGQSLAQGPSGPAWRNDAVSADWFSDLNDAIAAAGAGGTVRLSGANYTIDADALRLLPRVTIEGADPRTSRLIVNAGTGILVATPGSMCDYVTLRNLTLNGQPGSQVGIDARGLTRSLIQNVYVNGFEDTQIWYGGDSSAYHSGWTNTFIKGEVNPPNNATGFRFSGVTGTGASTPNNIGVYEAVVNIGDTDTSYGFDFQDGDTNLVQHCDVGYSYGTGIAFLLSGSGGTSSNSFISNRTEDAPRSVVITGGASYNAFIRNQFGGSHATYHPVEISGAAQWTTFIANSYSAAALRPHVQITGPATNTVVQDMDTDPRLDELKQGRPAGSLVISNTVPGEALLRFGVYGSGAMAWYSGSSLTMLARLRMLSTSTGIMSWDDDNKVKVPRVTTALPSASSINRGVMLRVEGATGVADGTYICIKNAADAYEWVNITP